MNVLEEMQGGRQGKKLGTSKSWMKERFFISDAKLGKL